ncbi:unnamed protein product [Urochloa decumbens]|uniref:Uncharacterized protein n=1 Tax=Urochloa decumbens TaxID=240449 RepID=A0ABC8ZKV1_9POAL
MANIDEGAGEPIDRWRHPREARVLTTRLTFLVVSTLSVFALGVVLLVATEAKEATEFSMELSAFEGLNATASETVLSPAFSLKLHVKNSRVLQPWCSDGGEVVVSYSDVALAWCRAPCFCVQRRAPTELALLPWGREVGLSDDVLRRLASELHGGTAQVTVGMKLFYDAKGWSSPESYRGTSLQLFQLLLGSSTERRNK